MSASPTTFARDVQQSWDVLAEAQRAHIDQWNALSAQLQRHIERATSGSETPMQSLDAFHREVWPYVERYVYAEGAWSGDVHAAVCAEVDQLRSLAGALPETETRPIDGSLYDAAEGDGWSTARRKRKMRRRLSKGTDATLHTHDIPWRSEVSRWVTAVLEPSWRLSAARHRERLSRAQVMLCDLVHDWTNALMYADTRWYEDEHSESRERISEEATRLRSALSDWVVPTGLLDDLADMVQRAPDVLEHLLATGGTFLYNRPSAHRDVRPFERLAAWQQFEARLGQSLAYQDFVIRLRTLQGTLAESAQESLAQVAKRLFKAHMDPVLERLAALRDAVEHGTSTDLGARADEGLQTPTWIHVLGEEIPHEVGTHLGELEHALLEHVFDDAPLDSIEEALRTEVMSTPDRWYVFRYGEMTKSERQRLVRLIRPHRHYRWVVDQPYAARLSATRIALAKKVRRRMTEAQAISEMLHYAAQTISSQPADEGGADRAMTDGLDALANSPHQDVTARTVIERGVSRALRSLGELEEALYDDWNVLCEALEDQLRWDVRQLRRSVERADTLGSLATVGSLTVRQWALRLRDLTVGTVSRLWKGVIRLSRFGRQHATTLIREGQTAVGVVKTTHETFLEAQAALIEPVGLFDALPPIYRRLFTSRPIADAALMPRVQPLAALIETHVGPSSPGRGSSGLPLLVHGRPGDGLTSLFRLLGRTYPTTCSIPSGVESEANLVAFLANALAVKHPPEETPTSLVELLERRVEYSQLAEERPLGTDSSNLSSTPERASSGRRVVLVEHLEHLVSLSEHGTQLLSTFLSFAAETSSEIAWVLGMNRAAWMYAIQLHKPLRGYVREEQLPVWTRDDLEAALMARHRRSGLKLVFEEENESNRPYVRLARLISRRGDAELRSRNAFFDDLHQASGGSMALAIRYWLRSVRYDPRSDEHLLVTPLQVLDRSYIQGLPLSYAFTLRAILIQGSITAAMHRALFRLPGDEPDMILDTLRHAQLIAAVAAPRGTSDRLGAEELRYHIHPMSRSLVYHELARRNLLHGFDVP